MGFSLRYKYITLYVLIAVLPFSSYFTKGSVPLTSYDPQLTYSLFLYNYNKVHTTGLPPFNNLYGMGIDTASIDPAFNAYRLPNLVAYIFSDPMQGWILLLVMQYILMGLCSFMYFRYVGLQEDVGFLCSIIYMLTPLNDEFIYQNFWGFIYLFAPILLLTLHKINDKRYNILMGALWIGLIFTLTYLSAGSIGVMYLSFGSLLYIMFIFVSWQNIIYVARKFFFVYFIGALLSIGMSSYILIPFIVEAWFMERATVTRDMYYSLSQYIIYLLQNSLSLIIPIRLDCTLQNINLVGRTELTTFFDNTWLYINIALLPALIYIFRYRLPYRRFAYLLLFIFYVVLTPPFILNLDIITINILKSYTLQKLYMFYSLAGCVLIGFYFQHILKANNKKQSLLNIMIGTYIGLIFGFLILTLILYLTEFSASRNFLLISKFNNFLDLRQIRQLLVTIIMNPFKFSLIFHHFKEIWWLLFLYYLSILSMLLMIFNINKLPRIFNKSWTWIYILLIILNVNLLYNYSYALINKDVLAYYYLLPNHNDENKAIYQGDRVAFYVDLGVKKLDETMERYLKSPIEEIKKTAERLQMIDSMSTKDMELYSQAYESSQYMYIRSYLYFLPYIHGGISQYSVYMHFLYPGYRQYYFNLNKQSKNFTDIEKTAEDIYKYSYLYDYFDTKAASRLGIRMIIANAPMKAENMSFISKTSKGLYIYENNDTYPSIKLTFTSRNNAYKDATFLINKYFELDGKESVIKLTTLELGEKVITTTIPYNKHWTIIGDGNPLKVYRDMNLFIGARVPSGVRTIELKYYNENFKIGIVISCIFWFIWLGLYFINKRIIASHPRM